MTAPDPADAGLQVERTMLSWLRSTLALIVGVAVVMNHFAPGDLAISLLSVASAGLATASYARARTRLRRPRADAALEPAHLPDAAPSCF